MSFDQTETLFEDLVTIKQLLSEEIETLNCTIESKPVAGLDERRHKRRRPIKYHRKIVQNFIP
ncbi:hypothetical protein [Facklamia miroungae]|uniref:hypothetical protein n=1 Tax=Facklamia miroungae TaxID=120956 RepID=UPI000B7FB5F9|nr:hypothetical protein [Facklamia miroungae]NKZ29273.1 hypothetical protein [Facklamia miroungae]